MAELRRGTADSIDLVSQRMDSLEAAQRVGAPRNHNLYCLLHSFPAQLTCVCVPFILRRRQVPRRPAESPRLMRRDVPLLGPQCKPQAALSLPGPLCQKMPT